MVGEERWPKHFLYVSPSKVDALYHQMEKPRVKQIAKKLTIDLKIVQAELAPTPEPETVYSRLRVVLQFLRDQEMVGSMTRPGPYFMGALSMKWGPLESDITGGLVWFGAVTKRFVVGLGGSTHNVVGATGGASASLPLSQTPYILDVLEELNRELGRYPFDGTYPFDENVMSKESYDDAKSLAQVELASRHMEGPSQDVEFVAKRLFWGREGLRNVILGTPLYVASAD